MNNPFLITGYIDPEHFCDREVETERIISSIKNRRNLTLYSLRRMGKTGLIKHVFYQMKNSRKYSFIYLDILPTNNLTDFIEVFSKGVFGKLKDKPEKLFSLVAQIFTRVRPRIEFDPLTGNPQITFDIKTESEKHETLENLFQYLNEQKTNIIIAIDEFQRILYYPEKNVESLLRKHIQSSVNTNFIFAGSEKRMMLSIFGEHSRPFYQSTEIMSLDSISKQSYADFIHTKFSESKMKISEDAAEYILDQTRRHTFYVQYFCNKIFSEQIKKIDLTIAKETMIKILEENKDIYYSTRKLISDYQWNLLRSIAKEDEVKMVTSKEFIDKYGLTSPSSVQAGLKALLAKELIFYENNSYKVLDVFMSLWLQRN